MSAVAVTSVGDVLELLRCGDVEVLGLLPYSSNYVFLAKVTGDGQALAVYKPRKGERPLWDFASGTLAAREAAAFAISEAAGWRFVPPTVLRPDGPLGEGSLQLFIDHDPERHYFSLVEDRAEDVVPFAAFDVVVNNADRKGGHILEDRDGRLWGVDHGLAFNVEPKLRTVIWDFAGDPLPPDVVAALERLIAALEADPELAAGLGELLAPDEVATTRARAEDLLERGAFPHPVGERPLPWPLI